MPQDLIQTYLLLLAARQANKHFIAFYNCKCPTLIFDLMTPSNDGSGGSNSGASQPHKHIQFIEVGSDGPPIEKFARKIVLEVSGNRMQA